MYRLFDIEQALYTLNPIHTVQMNMESLACTNRRVTAQTNPVMEQDYAICNGGPSAIGNIANNMLLGIIKSVKSLVLRTVNAICRC